MTQKQLSFVEIFDRFDPQVSNHKMQSFFNSDLALINEAHIKSLHVMMSANKLMADRSQAVLEIYSENIRAISQEISDTVGSADTQQKLVSKQQQLMATALSMTFKSSMQARELANRTQREVSSMISARIVESLEEIKDSTSKFS